MEWQQAAAVKRGCRCRSGAAPCGAVLRVRDAGAEQASCKVILGAVLRVRDAVTVLRALRVCTLALADSQVGKGWRVFQCVGI